MCLFIPISILAISGYNHIVNDQWSGQNKAQHFIAPVIPTVAGNEYAQHQGNGRDRSAATGLTLSVSPGTSKELWDSRSAGSDWSWKDFAWGVIGASTGYAVWQLIHY